MTRRLASPLRLAAGTALAASLLSGLSGCLISSRSSSSMTGSYVGAGTFEKIEVGETTDDWLLGALGTPSTRTCLEDGTDVWTWSHTRTTESSGSVLFLFGGSSSHVTAGSTCVELREGVVTRKWRD